MIIMTREREREQCHFHNKKVMAFYHSKSATMFRKAFFGLPTYLLRLVLHTTTMSVCKRDIDPQRWVDIPAQPFAFL